MRPAGRADPREIAALLALTGLPLLPFLPMAISIDAPVFVAVARQIAEFPGDPFGFQMVWDSTSPEAAVFNRNPPLLSYYLAPWIRWFGERDAMLHALVLPFPLIAALTFFGIARRLTGEGLAPAALLVTAPAFVVLASGLLLDVPTLAFLLLAVYALLRGLEGQSGAGWQWAAGLAAAAAGLTKYVGLGTAPLLVVGAVLLAPRRRLAVATRVSLPPLLAWGAWCLWTAKLYGVPHPLGSSGLVLHRSLAPAVVWNQVASTLVYYGAALAFPIALWLTALLRPRRGVSELAVVGVLLGTAAVYAVLPEGLPPRREALEGEEAVLAALGFAGAFALWAALLRPRRLRASRLDAFLALWSGALLIFSALLNWHVNAADALLAAPPVLLLWFRHPRLRPSHRWVVACAAPVLALSLLLAAADAIQANFYRSTAQRIAAEIGDAPGARWFVGNWGLQHYLEREGFRPVLPPTYGRSELAEGDWVASARNVSQLDVTSDLARYAIREAWSWELRSWLPLCTTNADASAGFYSHHSGYTPFAWSTRTVERVGLGRVVRVRGPSGATGPPRSGGGPARPAPPPANGAAPPPSPRARRGRRRSARARPSRSRGPRGS